jgi:hypothetical protein
MTRRQVTVNDIDTPAVTRKKKDIQQPVAIRTCLLHLQVHAASIFPILALYQIPERFTQETRPEMTEDLLQALTADLGGPRRVYVAPAFSAAAIAHPPPRTIWW